MSRPGQSRPEIAVYTAIYGDYDELQPQVEIPGVAYICFTEQRLARRRTPRPWQIVRTKPPFDSPRLAAKYFKMLPHEVLPEFRYTVWIDGVFAVTSSRFTCEALPYADGAGMALFHHPDRDCVYAEAEFCRLHPKYKDLPILEQVAHYRAQGYPARNGLFYGGVILRDRDDPRIRQLNELWMAENLNWTYQDQLSLPYLAWKLGLEPAVFPYPLPTNPWLRRGVHLHPGGRP